MAKIKGAAGKDGKSADGMIHCTRVLAISCLPGMLHPISNEEKGEPDTAGFSGREGFVMSGIFLMVLTYGSASVRY